MIALSGLADTVLSTRSDAIVAADKDGTIRFWNPGAVRIYTGATRATFKSSAMPGTLDFQGGRDRTNRPGLLTRSSMMNKR